MVHKTIKDDFERVLFMDPREILFYEKLIILAAASDRYTGKDGVTRSIYNYTYADMANKLGCTQETVRKKVNDHAAMNFVAEKSYVVKGDHVEKVIKRQYDNSKKFSHKGE